MLDKILDKSIVETKRERKLLFKQTRNKFDELPKSSCKTIRLILKTSESRGKYI